MSEGLYIHGKPVKSLVLYFERTCALCESELLKDEKDFCGACRNDSVSGHFIMWVDTLQEAHQHFMVMEQYRRHRQDGSEEKPDEEELEKALSYVSGIVFHVE